MTDQLINFEIRDLDSDEIALTARITDSKLTTLSKLAEVLADESEGGAMSKPQEELKQRLLTHMSKDYPKSRQDLGDVTDEEMEILDSMAEFINSEVRALLDRLLNESVENINGVKVVGIHHIESERQNYE